MLRYGWVAAGGLLLAACGRSAGPGPARGAAPDPTVPPSVPAPGESAARPAGPTRPALPPQLAYLAGLMPLKRTGVEAFREAHPTFDGRGVVIGILDGGVDPGVPGMARTSEGTRKLLDLRDFSGEGRVPLTEVSVTADGRVTIEGFTVAGVGRLMRLAPRPYYGGVFRERALGSGPAADVNGDGDDADVFSVVVGKASDGWVVMTDTNGDGSLEDERPLHDYAVAAETFTYGSGPMTLAANLTPRGEGPPALDLYFDNSSHGTHVAGIAAGHNLFGVEGFAGVAPGAQVLALKIAHNARGKISVTGSMIRAMRYAADYAARRGLPLVLNLSYGVGNETEGHATIDSLVAQFAREHPDVPVVVSAGNDGPGLSTLLFPASADFVLSVCALFPGEFIRPPEPGMPPEPDLLGWWSSRGGEVAKPDVCAPGVAFSNVPPWGMGEEISAGTSMAAPHVAGAVALLQSALAQRGRRARAIDLKRAVLATARPVPGASPVDAGHGVLDLPAAYGWLQASHQSSRYLVRSLPDGGNTSHGSGAYRRAGLASPGDTIQRFLVTPLGGQAAARLMLATDADWLRAPSWLELSGTPATVEVRYDAARLREPGLYVGTVWVRQASDTLAGPAFTLTSTVVVPRRLEQPFEERGTLRQGDLARYYFAVPPDAGGLAATIEIGGGAKGSLYLFEPTGQPHRGGGRIEVGGTEPRRGALVVRAGDVVPGVYEAVVVAPPSSGARYRITAALPAVAVDEIGPGATAVLRNRTDEAVDLELRAHVVGAARSVAVQGSRGGAQTLRASVPTWADRLMVDIRVAPELWHTVTDFGFTVFDAAGRRLTGGPLNYAFGRQEISVDSLLGARELQLELLPAFAREEPPARWDATVDVHLLSDTPRALPLDDSDAVLQLPPGGSARLRFAPVPPDTTLPPGYQPLLEVVAGARGGVPSIRSGIVTPR